MFRPGKTWLDADGKPIQAHGGGVNFFNGRYYWYGENKTGCSLEAVGREAVARRGELLLFVGPVQLDLGGRRAARHVARFRP